MAWKVFLFSIHLMFFLVLTWIRLEHHVVLRLFVCSLLLHFSVILIFIHFKTLIKVDMDQVQRFQTPRLCRFVGVQYLSERERSAHYIAVRLAVLLNPFFFSFNCVL